MSTSRPNILHIFTDQQRFDTIGALGNPVIRTPNLDRLAREGTAFTSAYSASPVCISARCSMIYGQYPMNTGCYENQPMPQDGRQSLMDALGGAGYRVHGIGKCHFSPDSHAMRGFQSREMQEEIVGDPARDDYLTWLHAQGYDYVCDPHGIRGEMYYVPQPAQFPPRAHPTQWIGDRARAFIEEQEAESRPWYLFTSFIHPHPPFAPPNPWHKLYRAPMMPLPNVPPDAEALWTWVNRAQNRSKYRDLGFDLHLVRSIRAYYYACISFIDYQVGRLLEALERTGQLDRTLIVFLSDHGEHLGDYRCFGKRSMHDTAARVPLLARLPERFPVGGRCSRPVGHVDVLPTLLSAAGAELTSHEPDGVDLAEVAAGRSDREMVFSQHHSGRRATYMAVSEDWKYFYSAGDDAEFLFDRRRDPQETRNRAGVPFAREAGQQMRRALMECLRAGGETEGLAEGDQWRRFPPVQMPRNPDGGTMVQDHPWADIDIPGYTD